VGCAATRADYCGRGLTYQGPQPLIPPLRVVRLVERVDCRRGLLSSLGSANRFEEPLPVFPPVASGCRIGEGGAHVDASLEWPQGCRRARETEPCEEGSANDVA
jgi:hypothetical protein